MTRNESLLKDMQDELNRTVVLIVALEDYLGHMRVGDKTVNDLRILIAKLKRQRVALEVEIEQFLKG